MNNEKHFISAILTTYNRKALLCRAIDSVLNQTLAADEIIVVDDGSTDGTQEYVVQRYPGIHFIHQKNSGVSAARNRAIEIAQGNWLAFLDSDDEWLPEKLARQMEALSGNPGYRICHTDEIWMRKGRRVNPKNKHTKYGGQIFKQCLPLCVISPSSVMIHHTVFQEMGLFDTSLPACEDYDLWLRICAYLPVLFVPELLLIKYGGHPGQLSQKHWGMDRFRIQALEKIIADSRLDIENKGLALQMIIEKTQIFLLGARKRNRRAEIKLYEEKLRTYQAIYNTLNLLTENNIYQENSNF